MRLPPTEKRKQFELRALGLREFAGVTIDNTDLSPYETADRVQALTTSGKSLVWRPA